MWWTVCCPAFATWRRKKRKKRRRYRVICRVGNMMWCVSCRCMFNVTFPAVNHVTDRLHNAEWLHNGMNLCNSLVMSGFQLPVQPASSLTDRYSCIIRNIVTPSTHKTGGVSRSFTETFQTRTPVPGLPTFGPALQYRVYRPARSAPAVCRLCMGKLFTLVYPCHRAVCNFCTEWRSETGETTVGSHCIDHA